MRGLMTEYYSLFFKQHPSVHCSPYERRIAIPTAPRAETSTTSFVVPPARRARPLHQADRLPRCRRWSLGSQRCRYGYGTAGKPAGDGRNFRGRDTADASTSTSTSWTATASPGTKNAFRTKLTAELQGKGGFNVVTIIGPGSEEGGRNYRSRGRSWGPLLQDRQGQGVSQRRVAEDLRVPGLRTRDRIGGAETPGAPSTRGWQVFVRHERALALRTQTIHHAGYGGPSRQGRPHVAQPDLATFGSLISALLRGSKIPARERPFVIGAGRIMLGSSATRYGGQATARWWARVDEHAPTHSCIGALGRGLGQGWTWAASLTAAGSGLLALQLVFSLSVAITIRSRNQRALGLR